MKSTFFLLHTAIVLAGNINAWKMDKIRTIQARAQSDEPIYKNGRFISSFPLGYVSGMDSVNTATFGGALMYIQAEAINYAENSLNECKRKNNVEFIVFYDIKMVNTADGLALHQTNKGLVSEYCPFVAFDEGQCSRENNKFKDECHQYHGSNNQPKIGPCVGGEPRINDARAPYDESKWFSFPNSCVKSVWREKNTKCREAQPGGLCPDGFAPDGESCTFSYEIMGYVAINDLVGISQLNDSTTGEPYESYTQFCKDTEGEYEGIEFLAEDNGKKYISSIPFWEDPFNRTANTIRVETLIDFYQQTALEDSRMKPLPELSVLEQENPKCYQNSYLCFNHKFGCKREGHAQLCTLCTQQGEDGCVVTPSDASFPTLIVPTPPPAPDDSKADSKDGTSDDGKGKGNGADKMAMNVVFLLFSSFFLILY